MPVFMAGNSLFLYGGSVRSQRFSLAANNLQEVLNLAIDEFGTLYFDIVSAVLRDDSAAAGGSFLMSSCMPFQIAEICWVRWQVLRHRLFGILREIRIGRSPNGPKCAVSSPDAGIPAISA